MAKRSNPVCPICKSGSLWTHFNSGKEDVPLYGDTPELDDPDTPIICDECNIIGTVRDLAADPGA